ncbi:MAG: hypothetical protein ABFD97_10720 [Syntrophobacter sp.]
MTKTVWLKALALWLAIHALAILNGILREKMLIPASGSFAGFMASGTIFSLCIILMAFAAVPWYGPLASSQWLLIGLLWLLLTLMFEFSFGRFAQHRTWAEIFDAYTFRGGKHMALRAGCRIHLTLARGQDPGLHLGVLVPNVNGRPLIVGSRAHQEKDYGCPSMIPELRIMGDER